jgi:hypothetical protein
VRSKFYLVNIYSDFITPKLKYYYLNLGQEVETLLETDPKFWEDTSLYHRLKKKVVALKVTNDCAERAIALMANYNHSLANDEGKKRNILQVVENNRKRVKSITKQSLKTYDTI